MSAPADLLAQKLAHLPESPGVYLWKDAAGTVLYVGKAKRLRSRVRSYVASDAGSNPKTRLMMSQAVDVESIVVPTEAQALILEANLIKEHRPRYNILLRDDKSYPYIKVTVHEPFPRAWVTRRVLDDGARYFGPYTDVGAMRQSLNVVKRIFTVRSCNWDMPKEMPERACLDYHIGRCQAPCIGAQTRDAYRLMIDEVVLFLDGKTAEVRRRVRERMEAASNRLDFERAGALRDALVHLEHMEEPTVIVTVEGGDRDVVGYARDGDDACIAILRVRGGKLLAREHRLLEHAEGESDGDVLAAYLARTWPLAVERAAELLVPFDFDDRALFEESVPGVRVLVPQRGPKREVVQLAEQNARHLLEEFKLAAFEADERAADPVYELQRELGLRKVPRALVCFDISHAQGTDTVASCVWFENGRPKRAEYRKFKIKTVDGIDDFASIAEVVTRYFTRRIEERKPLPDLVVIDGGKGQLGAAHAVLNAMELGDLQLISLAKRDEEIFVVGRSESLRIAKRSPALRMLQQARDEAHRFAITFQRARRTARTVTSELLKIPGVGPGKRRALLAAFGSIDGVRAATPEAIGALPGFSAKSGAKLLAALTAMSPVAVTREGAPAPVVAPEADAAPAASDDPAAPVASHHTPSVTLP